MIYPSGEWFAWRRAKPATEPEGIAIGSERRLPVISERSQQRTSCGPSDDRIAFHKPGRDNGYHEKFITPSVIVMLRSVWSYIIITNELRRKCNSITAFQVWKVPYSSTGSIPIGRPLWIASFMVIGRGVGSIRRRRANAFGRRAYGVDAERYECIITAGSRYLIL